MNEFKVGDVAVYPAHGVGKVTAIETKQVAGQFIRCYVFKVIGREMTILIPETNVEKVGLREVISPKKVGNVMSILKERDVQIDRQTWNRRYREYMEKIKTGSVFEIAEVMRDLYLLKDDKELSFGERKMLDMARGLLVKELSIARRTDEHIIEKELDKIFSC